MNDAFLTFIVALVAGFGGCMYGLSLRKFSWEKKLRKLSDGQVAFATHMLKCVHDEMPPELRQEFRNAVDRHKSKMIEQVFEQIF